jgi:Arc/MetJ family transcription regulator
MSMTTLDLDDDALAEAMRLSGVKTKKETVNTALREYAARHRRIAALEQYAALAQGWDYAAWEQQHQMEKAAGRGADSGGVGDTGA